MTEVTIGDPKKHCNVHAGDIHEDTFHKTVKANHYMRKHAGYGIQQPIVQELWDTGIDYIVIHTEDDRKYKSTVAQWVDKQAINYGHGKQYFLALEEMTAI